MILVWVMFMIRDSSESRRFIKGLLLGAILNGYGQNRGGGSEHVPHYYPLPY
jgi:hypothetical protein